ncbi:MAG: TetR/AcrR family transcriptional regulator C-terminal domain-containing protein [Polyangiaceae bacterium]
MSQRNPFVERNVASRRGGPVKDPLSRDRIVQAAYELLAEGGLESMSLRKVAARLETGAASLYAYVEDLRELQALVLDHALGKVRFPKSRGQDWRSRLVALLRSYVNVLIETPGLAHIAMNSIAAGPNALRIIEAELALLEEAGVGATTSAWAVDLLSLYGTAIAAEQSHRKEHGNPFEPLLRTLEQLSAREYPRVHASRESLVSGDGEERFEWAIDVLLNGLLRSATPNARASVARKRSPGAPSTT